MTDREVHERYMVPMEVLCAYEGWMLCGTKDKTEGHWDYDASDLERLGMVMTLRGIGFSEKETEAYMRLESSEEKTDQQRIQMLNEKRKAILEEIHSKEKQISCLDYLQYEITDVLLRKENKQENTTLKRNPFVRQDFCSKVVFFFLSAGKCITFSGTDRSGCAGINAEGTAANSRLMIRLLFI